MLVFIPNQLSTNLNQQSNIAILILAAGNSTRMGKPKQLLKWKSATLLDHTIDNATSIKDSNIFVILGAYHELIKSKIQHQKIQIIFNINWELGLGSSIAEGVKHLISTNSNYEGVLLMLADQPIVDSSYLKTLQDAFEVGKKKIVASDYGNNKLGVPALFDSSYIEELSELNQDKGAKKIIENHIDNVIVLKAKHLISDIDTKEDYERLYHENH